MSRRLESEVVVLVLEHDRVGAHVGCGYGLHQLQRACRLALHAHGSWRAGFHSVSRLRAYALSAELNTIASARTLVERIACTSLIAHVAWRRSQQTATALQVRRPSVSWRAGFHSVTSDVASSGSSPFDLSDTITQ